MRSRQLVLWISLALSAGVGCARTSIDQVGGAGRAGGSSWGTISGGSQAGVGGSPFGTSGTIVAVSSGAVSVRTGATSGASGTTSTASGSTSGDAAVMSGSSGALLDVGNDGGSDADAGACATQCGGDTCVDLTSDPHNCGGCGLLCSTCKDAHCAQMLTTVQDIVASLVVQGDNLYWVNASAGTIGTIPSSGGAAGTVPTTVRAQYHLAANPTNLSWWDAYDGIWTAPLTGGDAIRVATIATNFSVTAMTMDDGNVYWADDVPTVGTNSGAIMAAPLGGQSKSLASNQASPAGIAVDAANIYWTDRATGQNDGAVMQLAFGTNAPMAIAGGQTDPVGIAVDSHDVYWVSGTGVFKVPIGGGTITSLSNANTPSEPMFAVDGVSAYWIDKGTGAIVKAALAGGTVVQVVVPMVGAVGATLQAGLAVDATSVYWEGLGSLFKVTPK